ncbi:hypothetical protein CTAYLR_006091 [Chrysophaeum taylorii]|uniref:N-alpha-acetyltransferase 60 n=1 Tax=Chrysophaeum taylorii TaxID=2483200 RepID=A0AAD7XIM1_9STRA|nr:hypothetical protein CTAYLR_006091 [Chrysophaeum taylorii]
MAAFEVHFRPMRVSDLEEVRALHEEWFPVRYSYSFYDAAVRERMVGTNEPLFTLIAEVDEDDRRRIIGLPAPLFVENETSRVMYVLTLGSHARYRRRGIARELLQRCIARAEAEPACGAVYLHVITHNDVAIQFYKSNDFECLGEISDYYRIDGSLYNCFIYAYYLPRAKIVTSMMTSTAPRATRRLLSSTLSSLFPAALRSCFRSPAVPSKQQQQQQQQQITATSEAA